MPEHLCKTDTLAVRGGLGLSARKLNGRGPFTAAYLGGSITWGGNASDITRFSYRARTTAYLRSRFPQCEIREVDAGIGGTGSDLAAFRLGEDVMQFSPDLLFIEFAVNDTGKAKDLALSCIEGIVRQALRAEKPPEICFIYTLAQDHMPAIERGELPPSVSVQEEVAAHYGLPSINVALPVARAVLSKELEWSKFAGDTVHPTDFGHELYARTIIEGLTEFFDAPTPAARPLPAPLSKQPMESARMLRVPAVPGTFDGWTYRPLQKRGGWDCFSGVLESNTPGSEASFDFDGTLCGLYYLLGPESGDILCSIDKEPFESLRVFDRWSLDCWRPHYRILKADLKPGAHRLRVRVSDQRDPQSKGLWMKLAYVLCR